MARFIGSPTMNTVDTKVSHLAGSGVRMSAYGRSFSLPELQFVADTVTFGIRPNDLRPCSPEDAWFEGEISVVERLGSQTFGYLEVGEGQMFSVEFDRNADVKLGERICVTGDPKSVHIFDHKTGRRLN